MTRTFVLAAAAVLATALAGATATANRGADFFLPAAEPEPAPAEGTDLQAGYDAIDAGDYEAMADLMAENGVWMRPGGNAMGPTGLLDAMTSAGLAPSNGAGRRLVKSRGVSVNGEVVQDAGMRLDASNALHGRYHVVRRGRKNWHMLVVES